MRHNWIYARIILSILLLLFIVGPPSLATNGSPVGVQEATGEPAAPPTEAPTEVPTEAPTDAPTELPTEAATEPPTAIPTEVMTEPPTAEVTEAATEPPTAVPTLVEVTPLVELTADATLETLLAPAPLVARVEPVTEASLMAARVFVVNNAGDESDLDLLVGGACDTNPVLAGNQCTLRAAIENANLTPDKDTINFNISPGVRMLHTIYPTSGPLPSITQPVIINGMSESGYTWATPQIEVHGFYVGGGRGLWLVAGSNGTTIKGLVIDGGWDDGIRVSFSDGNLIQGNFIGVQAAGTVADGNLNGVYVTGASATNNVIGGTTAALRNVISGNFYGVYLDFDSSLTLVQGNYIGTNKTGTQGIAGSGTGVLVTDSLYNTIGGITAAARNVISGNAFNGVSLYLGAHNNTVMGNHIGLNAAGTGALPNSENGVLIESNNNMIGGAYPQAANRIANNVGDGIFVLSGVSNRLLTNSIYNNGGQGIDLFPDGVTANDPGDGDGRQNWPNLERVTGTRYVGYLLSSNIAFFRLQFFASPTCDSFARGEGQRYLGTASVMTDGVGLASFDLLLPVAAPSGWAVTATATSDTNNTSEFSWCVRANLGTPLLLSPANNSLTSNITPTFTWRAVAGAAEYHIQVSRHPTFITSSENFVTAPATSIPWWGTPLERGESYYWRVRAIAYSGFGPWSATWRINIAP